MDTAPGKALEDGRLLGRPRSYGRNSQEWNAFKFVFEAYVGVVAPAILAAMDHAESLTEPIELAKTSEADRTLSKLDVLTGPSLDRTSSATHDERG